MTSEAAHSRKSRLSVPAGGDPVLNSPGGGSSSGARAKVASSAHHHHHTTTAPSSMRPMQYLQRLTDVRQMDIQSALDQMKTLLSTRPQVVYKTAYYRKQTKNHWARDDPAFVALQLVFLVIASIAYAVAFRIKVTGVISFVLASVLWNWLAMGLLIATTCREIANRYLTVNQSSTVHVRQQVEWLYAFDIHCNSFFPVFVVLCAYSIYCYYAPLYSRNEKWVLIKIYSFSPLFLFFRWAAILCFTSSSGRRLVATLCGEYHVCRRSELVLVHYALGLPCTSFSRPNRGLSLSRGGYCDPLLHHVDWLSVWIWVERCSNNGAVLFHLIVIIILLFVVKRQKVIIITRELKHLRDDSSPRPPRKQPNQRSIA